jgi:hypothetical protein
MQYTIYYVKLCITYKSISFFLKAEATALFCMKNLKKHNLSVGGKYKKCK